MTKKPRPPQATTIKEGFSPRERALIATMLLLIAGVGGWYALVRPLIKAENAARARLVQATRDHGRVALRVALVEARPKADLPRETVPGGAAFPSWLAQTAVESGFPLDQQDRASGGRITLAANGVSASAALGWADRLERAGIRIESWSLRPDANGRLALTARMIEPQ